jgi:L-aminopeptidase/D-esterase-like protein
VAEVHAVLLGGGSAFGLDAAGGAMQYLEELGRGFVSRVARVPIVPAAILNDLAVGSASTRPGKREGYAACLNAGAQPVEQGNVGAGTGATVGKVLGHGRAMKGGLGSASVRLPSGVVVGAVVAVNCVGDVVDHANGEIVAGARARERHAFLDSEAYLRGGGVPEVLPGEHTTLVVVATNAYFTKAQANRLARLAYTGLARTIRPVTISDGDVVFSVASSQPGDPVVNLDAVGAGAADAVSRSVIRGVRAARGIHGYPACSDPPALRT